MCIISVVNHLTHGLLISHESYITSDVNHIIHEYLPWVISHVMWIMLWIISSMAYSLVMMWIITHQEYNPSDVNNILSLHLMIINQWFTRHPMGCDITFSSYKNKKWNCVPDVRFGSHMTVSILKINIIVTIIARNVAVLSVDRTMKSLEILIVNCQDRGKRKKRLVRKNSYFNYIVNIWNVYCNHSLHLLIHSLGISSDVCWVSPSGKSIIWWVSCLLSNSLGLNIHLGLSINWESYHSILVLSLMWWVSLQWIDSLIGNHITHLRWVSPSGMSIMWWVSCLLRIICAVLLIAHGEWLSCDEYLVYCVTHYPWEMLLIL